MPSFKLMNETTGNKGLSVAVSRHGGYKVIAEMLGLAIKPCETEFGKNYEVFCLLEIENKFKYDVEQMSISYPYDLIVEKSVKIDVKASRIVRNKNGQYFSFNLEKKHPVCDIFICFCIDNENIIKTYVIPACVLSGKSQLSVGIKNSIYDKYLDQWHYIKDFVDFSKEIINEQQEAGSII